MTAVELYEHATTRGVRMTLAEDGSVRCKAPQGILTPELVTALRAVKDELAAYLYRLAQPPDGASTIIPQVDNPYPFATRSWRTWVTGSTPAMGLPPLPEPTYRDVPTPCKTYLGYPCETKACQWLVGTLPSGRQVSLRFAPSRLCVGCWCRAKKHTTREDDV